MVDPPPLLKKNVEKCQKPEFREGHGGACEEKKRGGPEGVISRKKKKEFEKDILPSPTQVARKMFSQTKQAIRQNVGRGTQTGVESDEKPSQVKSFVLSNQPAETLVSR